MKLVFSSRGVVGDESATHHSQLLQLPGFGMVVEVVGDSATKISKQFLDEVTKAIQKSPPNSSSQLKKTLRKCRKQNQQIHYAAVYMRGEKLFAAAENRAEVWIKRGNKSGKVLTGGNAGTGPISLNDVVLLVTASLMSSTSDILIKRTLQKNKTSEIVDLLTTEIEKINLEKKGGALILEVNPQSHVPSPNFTRIKSTIINALKNIHLRIQRSRRFLVGAVIILVVIVGGVFFVSINSRENLEIKSIKEGLFEGKSLVDLDPRKAREVLERVKTEAISIDTAKLSKKDIRERDEILARVDEAILLALKRYEVNLTPFFDMSIIKQGAVIDEAYLYQDMLFLLDKKSPALYRLNTQSKASKLLAGGEGLRNVSDISVFGEEVYVFSTQGVRRVGIEGGLNEVIQGDPGWGEIVDVAMFGGNFYFLDVSQNILWKYLSGDVGFEPPQNYLLSDSKPDFRGGRRLMVDGAVWVLANGNIKKFIQGEEVFWQMSGLDEKIGTIDDIYTDEHTAMLYLLDKSSRILLVLDKNGIYQAQYRWQEDADISRIMVSEVLRKVFLLTSATIYSIDLR